MILLLFFCSGATALVYEVIWSKYLTLLFGSTIQAQTVVLAVFMGGLALGNRFFGSRADRARQPLALYGYLEVTIGLYAYFFSSIYKVADGFFAAAGSKLLDHSGWLLLLKGVLSAGLLLGPTILMGGTLPVLAAWLQKSTTDAGRRSARFYSTNSLGAVCGAGLAGFYLVTWLGLHLTLQMTALVNVIIGFTAVGIARRQAAQPSSTPAAKAAVPAQPQLQSAASVFRWGCVLVALTGAVSMGLEVLSSRCLCLIFGASLQAFAIVLMAFILGIGVGSAVIASPRRKTSPKEITTIALVLGAAGWIGLLVFNIEGLVEIYRQARTGLNSTIMGYRYYQVMAAIFSIFVLGLPAAAIGSVLPLWIRVVSETSDLLGDRVGRLLTWNTLGAVGGVLLTGFVLMPKLGLRGSFAALALMLVAAALFVAWARRQWIAMAVAVIVGGLLVVVSAAGGEGWRLVLSSGVFRLRGTEAPAISIREGRKSVRLRFYEDAADATVSVEENGPPNSRQLALRVNGKPDASTYGDLSTQLLLAYLPLMAKPDSQDVFVFGMGSGITAGATLGYPIERLTVAENCEPVLRAAGLFAPWNNGVLTNARTRVCREDARTVLKLSPRQYDVIIAEPSNPWMIGVGSVFSREFYELSASRLKPGGIMVQWFHVYEMSDGIVEMVMRTFGTVFPVVEIWDANDGDLILLGSKQPWKSDRAVYQRIFALEQPRRGLEKIGLTTPAAILARQFASQRTAFAMTGAGPIQMDDFPVLEYTAPQAFYIGRTARRLHRFDERTWQMGVASPEKNSRLAGLSEASLKAIFGGEFKSVNPELQSYISLLYEGRLAANSESVGGGLTLPCVFGGQSRAVLKPPPAAATNLVARQLFEAEVALQSDATQAQALGQIENILDSTQTYREPQAGWSATYYAGLAVKASLRRGEAQRAKKILLRGLQLEPDSEVDQYLARILVREGTLQPEEISAASAK
jgi:predicted membrane-bound spermidine synthase